MSRIIVNEDKCRGCGLCVALCPKHVLRLASHFNRDGLNPVEQFDPDGCIGCATCALMCPHVAIERVERTRAAGAKKPPAKEETPS